MKVISIIFYVLTILSAYGGRVNPQYFAAPSLLCLFMPYLGMVTVILVIMWAVWRKLIFTLLGVLTLIVCIPSMSQAIPLGFPRTVPEGARTFKIISWNVLHTDDIREPDYPGNRAVEYMVNSGADIICLTELLTLTPAELKKASPELLDSLFKVYPYHAGNPNTDIKVLSKYPVKRMGYSLVEESAFHRFDFFKFKFPENKELIVAMVHLYSYGLSKNERKVVTEIKSVKTAKESIKEFEGPILGKLNNAFRKRAENAAVLRDVLDTEIPMSEPLIVCGDFNDVPASWTYNLIKGDDLRDAYSETNIGPAFTYNLHRFYVHIDQMLYRGNLEALDLDVGKINTSDHYPLIGTFMFTE